MHTTSKLVLRFTFPIIVAGVALTACQIKQPLSNCTVAMASPTGHAAQYLLKPKQSVTGSCAHKQAEEVGFFKYLPAIQTAEGPRQDYNRPTLALRTDTLGKLTTDVSVNSTGPFQVKPDANEVCTAPTLTPASFTAQLDGGGTDTITYNWSNVRVLNKPEALGTLVTADLEYTEGGCTALYTMRAVWPMVTCGTGVPDGDGGTKQVANEAMCSPYADLDAGQASGSGINPDFPVTCDPVSLICVLKPDAPAF